MLYQGKVTRVFRQGPHWSSVKMKLDNGDVVTVSGKINFPEVGDVFEVDGDYIVDKQFGAKIDVLSSNKVQRINLNGYPNWLYSFLSSGLIKGLGEKSASKVLEKYKEKTLDVLKNKKEFKMTGFNTDRKNKIAISLKTNEQYVPIYKSLNGEVTANQAKKIFEEFKENSEYVIRNKPYSLVAIDGFGFLKVDKLALASHVSTHDESRISEGILYSLAEYCEEKGNVYAEIPSVIEAALKLVHKPLYKETRRQNLLYKYLRNGIDYKSLLHKLKVSQQQEIYELESWLKESILYIKEIKMALVNMSKQEKIVIDEKAVYTTELYQCENKIARIISTMCKSKSKTKITDEKINQVINKYETSTTLTLEKEQKDALFLLQHQIGVLTGGPGRGKTTDIQLFVEIYGPENTVLCAPTARAAQRMKESTGYRAVTLQKLLINAEADFLENKLVIVDESSMVDVRLAYKLLKISQRNTKIIFVGDVNQLASIGPGAFLKDLIDNPYVPTVFLIKCHRNAGAIENNSVKINDGESFNNLQFNDKMLYLEATKETIQPIIIESFLALISEFGIREVCILVPTKTKSSTATYILNKLIQEKLNPFNPDSHEVRNNDYCFRINDRVMYLKNNYRKETICDNEVSLGVFNGDCGIITNINKFQEVVTITFDDGRISDLDFIELNHLILAYAMTIHKAQGSEYKAVIIGYTTENFIMLKRNSFYTGVTRAKKHVRLIGEKKAFSIALRTEDDSKRNTKLNQRICFYVDN